MNLSQMLKKKKKKKKKSQIKNIFIELLKWIV